MPLSPLPSPPSPSLIELRGVRVHNLKGVDVEIPLRKLTVLCGVSGAGKSSLAFDTLYAESQRRYVQSFSAYARQFLERFDSPDADRIGFLPPAIAIRRAVTSPRATVGTLSRAASPLQHLFARLGIVICPRCGSPVKAESPESVACDLGALPEGTRFQIAFEWPISTTFEITRELLVAAGFSRVVWPDSLAPGASALVIVDRLTAGRSDRKRIRESAESAFAHGGGEIVALVDAVGDAASTVRTVEGHRWRECRYAVVPRCPSCRRTFAAPEPALFDHFSALGACPHCRGTGAVARPRSRERDVCPACAGIRLQPDSLAVQIGGQSLADLLGQTVQDLRRFAEPYRTEDEGRFGWRQLVEQLDVLELAGLGDLTLARSAARLSPGQSRRVQLAAALSTRLVNMLCVVDEPAAGLHPSEVPCVIQLLYRLRDAGNTIVAIEHNPDLIRAADRVIEIGPGAGPDGGTVTFSGTSDEWGARLAGTEEAKAPQRPAASPAGWLTLSHVRHRNLRNLTARFPLGVLCLVTGVSGSGKTSLVCDALFTAVSQRLKGEAPPRENPLGVVESADGITGVVRIDPRTLPRSARSTPGTVLGLLAPIRQLFAQTPDAQARNFGPAHFSFNASSGGRCPACEGRGYLEIDLQFLPDVRTLCPDCHGQRFRRETLDVRYRGLNVAEVLAMSARKAFPFFRGHPQLQRRLKSLKDVGLDYLPLGRPTDTLSNGELQRLRLAAWLRRQRSRTLFLLDEPSSGLHARDVTRLLEVFHLLLTGGHSVIAIDHHKNLLLAADHLIDLGPGAGDAGGRIVVAGSREEILACETSLTGQALRRSSLSG